MSPAELPRPAMQAIVEIGRESFDRGFGAAVEILREVRDDTGTIRLLAGEAGTDIGPVIKIMALLVESLEAARARAAAEGLRK